MEMGPRLPPMEAEKLIRITADDAGLDPQQDETILRLAQSGCLSGISFFVNMTAPSPLIQQFLSVPALSIGLHLNFTDGRPVSPASEIPSLVNSRGEFHGAKAFVRKALLGKLKGFDLLTEMRAQVNEFSERFGRMDHLDSHRHVHRFPVVVKGIAGVLSSVGLRPRVRKLSRCVVSSGSAINRGGYWLADLKRLPGGFLKWRAHRAFAAAGLPMNSGLLTPWPAIAPEATDAASRWAAVFRSAPTGDWEGNFHPGWNAAEAALLGDARFKAGVSKFLTKAQRDKGTENF